MAQDFLRDANNLQVILSEHRVTTMSPVEGAYEASPCQQNGLSAGVRERSPGTLLASERSPVPVKDQREANF
jgi:hypothetical protein